MQREYLLIPANEYGYFYEFDRDVPIRSGLSMFPFLPTLGVEVRF